MFSVYRTLWFDVLTVKPKVYFSSTTHIKSDLHLQYNPLMVIQISITSVLLYWSGAKKQPYNWLETVTVPSLSPKRSRRAVKLDTELFCLSSHNDLAERWCSEMLQFKPKVKTDFSYSQSRKSKTFLLWNFHHSASTWRRISSQSVEFWLLWSCLSCLWDRQPVWDKILICIEIIRR